MLQAQLSQEELAHLQQVIGRLQLNKGLCLIKFRLG